MDRRHFLNILATSSLGMLAFPAVLRAEDSGVLSALYPVPTNTGISGNIVIVGGGMAGGALAKYLRLWGGTGVNVTLIEMAPSYTSNIMSNTVITGQRTMADLNFSYDTLRNWYGVNLIQAEVLVVNKDAKTISLSTGAAIAYDRLVLAPGLVFDLMPGMTSPNEYETLTPHAWKAGKQTELLRQQLLELKSGARTGDVVITIPKAPYRCPPGPYERACVVADWLHTNNVNSKVIVLDANSDILVEKDNFSYAFSGAYGYVVDYRPNSTVTNVNSSSRTIVYSDGVSDVSITAGVLNPIPSQRAPQLIADAGLLNVGSTGADARFAPVNVLSYESTKVPGIHVLGDASHTTQPKAGHIANQEAKTCADAILRLLQGKAIDTNIVTNSACYTPITATTATWLSAVYQSKLDTTTGTWKMTASTENGRTQPMSAHSATTENYEDMIKWFNTLMRDTFV